MAKTLYLRGLTVTRGNFPLGMRDVHDLTLELESKDGHERIAVSRRYATLTELAEDLSRELRERAELEAPLVKARDEELARLEAEHAARAKAEQKRQAAAKLEAKRKAGACLDCGVVSIETMENGARKSDLCRACAAKKDGG